MNILPLNELFYELIKSQAMLVDKHGPYVRLKCNPTLTVFINPEHVPLCLLFCYSLFDNYCPFWNTKSLNYLLDCWTLSPLTPVTNTDTLPTLCYLINCIIPLLLGADIPKSSALTINLWILLSLLFTYILISCFILCLKLLSGTFSLKLYILLLII